MKKWMLLLLFLLLAPCAAQAGTRGDAVRCEYAVYGGMENEDRSICLTRGEELGENFLTVRENGQETQYRVSWMALDDLTAYMDSLRPETWKDLPRSEYIALDAPTRRVTVAFEDGSTFSLTDDQEGSSGTLANLRWYLGSYVPGERETFSLRYSSFEGGGPSFRPVISRPEMLEWDSGREYHQPYDPMATGSGYDVILTFRGRIPGTVEMYIAESGPVTPLEDVPPTVYTLEIDEGLNVHLLGKEQRAADEPGYEAEPEPVPDAHSLLTVMAGNGQFTLGRCYLIDFARRGWVRAREDDGVYSLRLPPSETFVYARTRDGGLFSPVVSLDLRWADDLPTMYCGFGAGTDSDTEIGPTLWDWMIATLGARETEEGQLLAEVALEDGRRVRVQTDDVRVCLTLVEEE